MRAGIYALVDLAGGSVRPGDAAALGLPAAAGPVVAHGIDTAQPAAVNVASDADRQTLFLGFLDEPEALAASLGMAPGSAPVALVRAALARHGAEASRILRGEWSLLDWTRGEGVVLMGSSARRDPIFYARRGSLVAVAPDLNCLTRLDWVDRTIDSTGFLFALGRYEIQQSAGGRTIVGGVRRLESGGTVRLDAAGERTERADPFRVVAPFAGRFDDAMEEAGLLLRRIMRQRLARVPAAACLLSGGLDSSLLALLGAEERASAQPLVCLSSAAPADGGLADETAFARIVADHLGLPMEPVAPPASSPIYRPSDIAMLSSNQPSLSVRHYLYEALHARAETLNMPLVFDGSYGEWTMTAGMPVATLAAQLRAFARAALRRGGDAAVGSPFQVRLAPHRLSHLPGSVAEAWRTVPDRPPPAQSSRGRWGYLPGAERLLRPSTDIGQGRLRNDLPFRDLRLLELFASFPARFAVQDKIDRAPVRRVLRGRLPDAIVSRAKGSAFSPDYHQRLQAQAHDARSRIATFRAADIDDWLDLDWLDGKLAAFSQRGPAGVIEAFEVQLTAMTAEYLLWWQASS